MTRGGRALRWNMLRYALLLLATVPIIGGCSSYTLRGRVVEGEVAAVVVVNANDPRLKQPGLAHVRIDAVLDPRSLERQDLGAGLTQDDGTFSMPVNATGAGFLEYDLFIEFHRRGFAPTVEPQMPLPPAGKRLLVVMAPGHDRPSQRPAVIGDDIRREVDQLQKQFP